MSDKTVSFEVPLVPEMIHRPGAPLHMMRIKPVERVVTVAFGDEVLALSERALQVIELGRDVYDPVLYLPVDDVAVALVESGKSTHCPLKGDTTYFDLAPTTTRTGVSEIGWVYSAPLDLASALAAHIAFDTRQVTVIAAPR